VKHDFQKTEPFGKESPVHGSGPWLLAACAELQSPETRTLHRWCAGTVRLEVRQGRDTLWLVARWAGEDHAGGGLAFRLAWAPGGLAPAERSGEDDAPEFRTRGAMGAWRVAVTAPDAGTDLVRWTASLTPDADLLVPFWPRDVYPLDADGNPLGTGGPVHASQNNTGTAILYASLSRPRTGSFLYVQNLTSLNAYCIATHTEPSRAVGGEWPELGLQLPASGEKPLMAGREVVLSDALVRFSPTVPDNEREMARLFLDMLNDIYPHLDPPDTEYHDWPGRAEKTLRDVRECGQCYLRVNGKLYLHPFVDAEPPDSLTQVAAVKDMRSYAKWLGEDVPLTEELAEGLTEFYNREIGALMRYVPDCAGPWEKEGDSWYHYVPLGSLGWMAKEGDETAKRLFLDSLDWAVRSARHFEYRWPVFFDVKTFEVLKGPREDAGPGKPPQPGESDVGGVYAHVMVLAWELTGDEKYLREAENGIRAMEGYGFQVTYETSVTAWGAYGALRVWQATGDRYFLEMGYLMLAAFFQNVFLWESSIGSARHFPLFFGVKVMFNTAYKASYEIHDAFSAFLGCLEIGGDDLAPSAHALLAEYCRHGLHTSWYAYPSELPAEIIAEKQEYGSINPKLALPLEDLSAGWGKVGAVGQQVYGANIAFVYLDKAYHKPEGAPFILYCDVPVKEMTVEDGRIVLGLNGDGRFPSRIRLIPHEGKQLPEVRVRSGDAERTWDLEGRTTEEGHREFRPKGDKRLSIMW